MEKTIFSKIGYLIYRFRIAIIILWLIGAILCAPFLPQIMSPFKSTGFIADKAESTLTEQKLDQQLGYNQDNRFIIVYYSPNLKTNEKKFHKNINQNT